MATKTFIIRIPHKKKAERYRSAVPKEGVIGLRIFQAFNEALDNLICDVFTATHCH
jgi:hypothetical protein